MRRRASVAPSRLALAVTAIVVLALVLRLIGLGQRVAHWDEARVAYFALQYTETGIYEYRRITHGPFLHIVNGDLSFSILGASDRTARLIVAIAGAVLPATAWLFRDRLRPVEVIGMAGLLAVTPLILYYSRFMRNDLLLAAVMLAAFGLLLRYHDSLDPRYLYGATVLIALGFTMKENAIVYLVVWLGAALLVIDHATYRNGITWLSDRISSGGDHLRNTTLDGPDRLRRLGRRYLLPAVVSVVLFVTIVTYFYLPRGPDQLRLLDLLFEPTLLGEILRTGFIQPLETGIFAWTPSGDEGTLHELYFRQLSNMFNAITYGGLALFSLAVFGFAIERYRVPTREVVMFASYWGFVSLLGYPLAASVHNPAWLAVHVLVPLSIPAAVGLAWFVYRIEAAIEDGDAVVAGVAAIVLLLFGAQLGLAGVVGVYSQPASHDNAMVQYAQPDGSELRAAIDDIERAIDGNEGLDILYYGEDLYDFDDIEGEHPIEENAMVTARLPMTWYTLAMGANVDSERSDAAFVGTYEAETPPVVISTGDHRSTLEEHLPDHRVYEERFFPNTDGGKSILILIDEQSL